MYRVSKKMVPRLIPLRLQDFPRGLGKGSDAALVGAWLDTVMRPLDASTLPDSHC